MFIVNITDINKPTIITSYYVGRGSVFLSTFLKNEKYVATACSIFGVYIFDVSNLNKIN